MASGRYTMLMRTCEMPGTFLIDPANAGSTPRAMLAKWQ